MIPAPGDLANAAMTPIAPVSCGTKVGPKLGSPLPVLAGACELRALANADRKAARPLSTVAGSAFSLPAYTCAATSASRTFTRSRCKPLGLSTAWKYSA
jgi:hypothetical protein